MRTPILLIVFFLSACSSAQQKPDGVYAGVALFPGLNGLDLVKYTYYFRPDGSFSNKFYKPDWKTRTDGRYRVVGRTVIIEEKGDRFPDTLTIKANGSLDRGNTVLNKFEMVNKLPTRSFYNKSASSVGGIGTEMVYVGNFSNSRLAFDGKGNFSHSRFSTTAVIGNDIGGGANNASGGDGEATVKDGVLTLRYKDGKEEIRSFFYAQKPEEIALVNGMFFFVDDGKDPLPKGKTKSSGRKNSDAAEDTEERRQSTTVDADALLQRAHRAHGGDRLDELETLKMEGRLNNIPVVIFVDVASRRLRYEAYNNGKLLAVEQLDGNAGWQWGNGAQKNLAAARVQEMQEAFYTGFMGLRSDALNNLQPGTATADEKTGLVRLTVRMKGKTYVWIFDKESRLGGEVSEQTGGTTTTLSTDYRSVDGVWIPFKSTTRTKEQSTQLTLTSVEINEALPATVWSKPR